MFRSIDDKVLGNKGARLFSFEISAALPALLKSEEVSSLGKALPILEKN
jgi:hypothetical protein